MPEIKHTFTAGKMNKDLDERLVPNGEYRDALNVQIRTTDGDTTGEADAGTVQNIKGNEKISNVSTSEFGSRYQKTIASIADEKNDKAYFFMAAPTNNIATTNNPSVVIYSDLIVEQDVDGTTTPVVVDIWGITMPDTGTNGVMEDDYTLPTTDFIEFPVKDASKLRKDMKIYAVNSDSDIVFEATIENVITNIQDATTGESSSDVIQFYEPVTIPSGDSGYTASDITCFEFIAEPVLGFSRLLEETETTKITGINIIDDLLFWTDNYGEPKKINITRCKSGCATGSATKWQTHTKLKLKNPSNDILQLPSVIEDNIDIDDNLKEKHITVIRKAPRTAPTLHMSSSERDGSVSAFIQGYNFIPNSTNNDFSAGDIRVISEGSSDSGNEGQLSSTNFREGDILKITLQQGSNPVTLTARFITYEDEEGDATNMPTKCIRIQMVFDAPTGMGTWMNDWLIEIKRRQPIFETKFPRFGYRYKYEDGEYSSFSPWSELAFLPGPYDYKPKKAHNLGMENELRELIIKDFLPYKSKEMDVVSVDILYKTTDSPNVYVVKTITRGVDSEWELFTPSETNEYELLTGELTITSEMVHRVLPSNQTLRTWDNVPRYASAQEIVSNRLAYGNYTQGYHLPQPVGLKQSFVSTSLVDGINNPQKSIKSIRDYKVGMVFGDKYGRETPVVEYGYLAGNEDNYQSISGGVNLEKEFSSLKNMLSVTQDWNMGNLTGNEPPEWMEYVKYYIKETSSEYYNLVLDRWYFADDKFDGSGQQVWLSFNSSDRNKVDEETYLILKNQHGSHTPVHEDARYKIIAIENEAPTFIKTELRNIGFIKRLEGSVAVGEETNPSADIYAVDEFTPQNPDSVPPTNLMTGDTLQIEIYTWGNLIGPSTNTGLIEKNLTKPVGKLRFRIEGVNGDYQKKYSSWRTVDHFSGNTASGEADESTVQLHWSEVFGDEADMLTRFQEDPNTISTGIRYNLEFKEEVIDNKPEFEGKFFVKIENDANGILDENVLINSDEQTEYIVTGSYNLAYIESNETNSAVSGSYANEQASLDNDWFFGAFIESSITSNSMEDVLDQYQPGNDPGNANTINNGYWDNYVMPQTIASGFATFGWKNRTRTFWTQYRDNSPATLFIDAATTWRHGTFTSGDYADTQYDVFETGDTIQGNIPLNQMQDSYQNNQSSGNNGIQSGGNLHTPSGLDTHAGLPDGTLGRMVISHIHVHDQDLYNNSPMAHKLWKELQKPGTLFRFEADPDQRVYKVISVPGSNVDFDASPIGIHNYPDADTGNIPYCRPCLSPNTDAYGCTRNSIRIDFRRVYNGVEEGGQIGQWVEVNNQKTGIDTSSFDPRGEVKHDGSQALKIQLVGKFNQGGGQVIPVDNGAIWETEPKENTDLDLYYEASNALPIRLNRSNVFDYIPINSDISLKRPIANSTYETVNLTGEAHKVTNIHTSEGKSIVEIKSTSGDWDPSLASLHTNDIFIDDLIEFKHKDGTITRSKVVNYYQKVEGDFYTGTQAVPTFEGSSGSVTTYDFYETYIPQNEYDYTVTFSAANPTFSLPEMLEINTTDNLEVGMLLIGTGIPQGTIVTDFTQGALSIDLSLSNEIEFGTYTVKGIVLTGYYQIDNDVWEYPVQLSWFNCYSFGNGLESDRIRDDFNATTIDNGVKVSTTFSGYGQENKTSGLIYSGLYNSTSEVNNLNEFNMSEKITKDLNPTYGSIQMLKTRNTDVVVFTEDKVLKVLSSKDALFNADGKPQLTASNKVLGTAIPFAGDYGISKNPESLAFDQFRMYFTDKQRGAVLRLSGDGLTPISNVGMKTYFRENLKSASDILGTYDVVNGEYNLTFKNASDSNVTISFNEGSKGWVSFKSFIPETGVSVSGNYLTAVEDEIWKHYSSSTVRNNFYGQQYNSTIDVLFNDSPSSVKNFKTLSYEGSQAKVDQYTSQTTTDAAGNTLTDITDNEYYNLSSSTGWYVEEFLTDLSKGSVPEFIDKENKWFNKINGEVSSSSNLDTGDFVTQGIGVPSSVSAIYY